MPLWRQLTRLTTSLIIPPSSAVGTLNPVSPMRRTWHQRSCFSSTPGLEGKKLMTTFKVNMIAPSLIAKALRIEEKNKQYRAKRNKLGTKSYDLLQEDVKKLKIFNMSFINKLGVVLSMENELLKVLGGRGINFTKVILYTRHRSLLYTV